MTLDKLSKNPRNPRKYSIKRISGGWRFCLSAKDRAIRELEISSFAGLDWTEQKAAAAVRLDWFEQLVEKVEELGGPHSLDASDEIFCIDLDLFADEPSMRQRGIWLGRAKREALLRFLQERLTEIFDAAKGPDEIVHGLVNAFVGGDKIRPGYVTVPPGQGTLEQKFYGRLLPTGEKRQWEETAIVMGRASQYDDDDNDDLSEEDGAPSIVYFISTVDPGVVKIGRTSNLASRLRSLRTASHVEPTIHLTLPGAPALEAQLHHRFEADRPAPMPALPLPAVAKPFASSELTRNGITIDLAADKEKVSFNKKTIDLTMRQAAVLAALLRAMPSNVGRSWLCGRMLADLPAHAREASLDLIFSELSKKLPGIRLELKVTKGVGAALAFPG